MDPNCVFLTLPRSENGQTLSVKGEGEMILRGAGSSPEAERDEPNQKHLVSFRKCSQRYHRPKLKGK